MLIDPETALRLGADRLQELRREAALHRQTRCITPAWRRTAGRALHHLAHALLATPRAGAPAPAPTPCDDTPLPAV